MHTLTVESPARVPAATAATRAQVDQLRRLVERNARRWKRLVILDAIGLQQAAQSKPAFLLLAAAGIVLLVGFIAWASSPAQFANAASRILLPFADIDPIYRTTLEVSPGDVIAMGDVTIEIQIRGQRP